MKTYIFCTQKEVWGSYWILGTVVESVCRLNFIQNCSGCIKGGLVLHIYQASSFQFTTIIWHQAWQPSLEWKSQPQAPPCPKGLVGRGHLWPRCWFILEGDGFHKGKRGTSGSSWRGTEALCPALVTWSVKRTDNTWQCTDAKWSFGRWFCWNINKAPSPFGITCELVTTWEGLMFLQLPSEAP